MVKQRKIPLRKCSGCGAMKPKKELVRVVKSPLIFNENGDIVSKSEISLDLTGKKAGRGAYLCRSADCLKLARKSRRIEKSFECSIPDSIYEEMEKELLSDG